MILFALAPGNFPEPDHRCFERLARAAADTANAFASVIPEPVRAVLLATVAGRRPEVMPPRLISAWWGVNGRTTFFRHPETARVVRHTRGDDAEDGESAHAVRRRWRR